MFTMRSFFKVVFVGCGLAVFTGGCLSSRRDFSSPQTTIQVVDQNGTPMSGVEVNRTWIDSDTLKDGHDTLLTDQTGTARFTKVSANVGLCTGAWRKTYSQIGMCAAGSGTSTDVYVRFSGHYNVSPRVKSVTMTAPGVFKDTDGITYWAGFDARSNSTVKIFFPKNAKTIQYVLSAKPTTER